MTSTRSPRAHRSTLQRLILFLLIFLHLTQAHAMVAPAATAFHSIPLAVHSFTNTSQIVAGQDATFNVGGGFTNNGTIETGRDLNISAAWLSNGVGTTQTLSFGPSYSMAEYRYWVTSELGYCYDNAKWSIGSCWVSVAAGSTDCWF
jgi:adhesin HecA-like repeat protein